MKLIHFHNDGEQKINEDPSTFWTFIPYKRGKSNVSGVTTDNNNIHAKAEEIDTFGNYFKCVYIGQVFPPVITLIIVQIIEKL